MLVYLRIKSKVKPTCLFLKALKVLWVCKWQRFDICKDSPRNSANLSFHFKQRAMARYIPELIEYTSSGPRALGLRNPFKRTKTEMLPEVEPHRKAPQRKLFQTKPNNPAQASWLRATYLWPGLIPTWQPLSGIPS